MGVVSHIIGASPFLLLSKGDSIELVRVEDSGLLVSLHRQSLFCQIQRLLLWPLPLGSLQPEENLVGVVVTARGHITLFHYSSTQERFVALATTSAFPSPIAPNVSLQAACSDAGLIACVTLHGKLVIHRTLVRSPSDPRDLQAGFDDAFARITMQIFQDDSDCP